MPTKIAFTKEQIKDIIWMFSVNYKTPYIAKKYSCSYQTIVNILNRNGINTSKQYLYVLESKHIYCKHCDTVKSLDEFYADTLSKFGKKTKCRKCYKDYRVDNKHKIRKYKTAYRRNRLRTDSNYRLCSNLRCRLNKALAGKNKSASTLTLLGCSIEELKQHLQQTAIKNGYKDFDIESYSGLEYHVDHIKPCSSFNLEDPEEQRQCFNWSNLQILTAHDNLKKGRKS